MKGNVLISGGFGFIGSHIVNALSESSQREIFVYDVNGKKDVNPQEKERTNVVTLQGDIFDSDKLVKTMQEAEISDVIHMVGLASIPSCKEKPDASYKLNVSSVKAMLDAMRLSKAERIIFPSTAAVYGASNGPKVNEEVEPNPSTVYGSHKLDAEKLISDTAENYGFKPTILRLFNVYGDLNKEQGVISLFLRKALAGEPLIVKGGNQLRDFIFLHDVVKAFTMSLDNAASHTEIINVGSGVGVTVNEIAEMVRQHFATAQVKHELSNGNEYSIYADITRMKEILGSTPTNPRSGIPAFIQDCKLKCTPES
jgi:UDP-glucose 4-epimerase